MQPYYVATYSVSYLAFFILLLVSSKYHGNRLADEQDGPVSKPMILLLHIGGVLFLGGFCFYFSDQPLASIVMGKSPPTNMQVLVICLLIVSAVILGPLVAERKFTTVNVPAGDSFSPAFIINYFFVRILFLAVYEIWFRGCLLPDSIHSIGITAAIVLNVFLYCLLHVVNGKEEVKACVPLGLLFCGLCTWIGAAWPAILLHLAMTVSHEMYLVRKINKSSISFL